MRRNTFCKEMLSGQPENTVVAYGAQDGKDSILNGEHDIFTMEGITEIPNIFLFKHDKKVFDPVGLARWAVKMGPQSLTNPLTTKPIKFDQVMEVVRERVSMIRLCLNIFEDVNEVYKYRTSTKSNLPIID